MYCGVCGQDNPPEASFCLKCGSALEVKVEPKSTASAAYVGFWDRLFAAVIDGIIIGAVSSIIGFISVFSMYGLSGWLIPSFFSFPFYWIYHWVFIGLKGQTPGKMVLGIKVVDAQGNKPDFAVAALREILGKTISALIFCLGFLWIGADTKKQGWHDKIAATYVVKA